MWHSNKINCIFAIILNLTFPIDKITTNLTFIFDNYAKIKCHIFTSIRKYFLWFYKISV